MMNSQESRVGGAIEEILEDPEKVAALEASLQEICQDPEVCKAVAYYRRLRTEEITHMTEEV